MTRKQEVNTMQILTRDRYK